MDAAEVGGAAGGGGNRVLRYPSRRGRFDGEGSTAPPRPARPRRRRGRRRLSCAIARPRATDEDWASRRETATAPDPPHSNRTGSDWLALSRDCHVQPLKRGVNSGITGCFVASVGTACPSLDPPRSPPPSRPRPGGAHSRRCGSHGCGEGPPRRPGHVLASGGGRRHWPACSVRCNAARRRERLEARARVQVEATRQVVVDGSGRAGGGRAPGRTPASAMAWLTAGVIRGADCATALEHMLYFWKITLCCAASFVRRHYINILC